jgi:hypothetical protein
MNPVRINGRLNSRTTSYVAIDFEYSLCEAINDPERLWFH